MEKIDVFSKVDHTLLKQDASWEDIREICDDAIEYKTASICIPASYVKRSKDHSTKPRL